MDHKNMSLEDLIKKDKQRKRQGGGNFRGRQGGFKPNQNRNGNQVPAARKTGLGFKPRFGGQRAGGDQGMVLPPRAGQKGEQQTMGQGARINRVRKEFQIYW